MASRRANARVRRAALKLLAVVLLSGVVWSVWPPARAQQGRAPAPTALPADMKPYVETIPGTDVQFEMVPVPGGTFLMGSPPDEPGRSPDEGPQHLVMVGPFWISKTEVTWDEYDIFAFKRDLQSKRPPSAIGAPAGADATTRPSPPYGDESFGFGKRRMPAINMTHHAAMEYARWLSSLTGRIYRLPTEAEWERACRAGTTTIYSFGNDVAKLGEYAWYLDNANGRPHPVAQKRPNTWGIYDMHGNVAEWVLDQYDANFYASSDPKTPVISPVRLPDERRYPHVVRGGSWDDEPPLLRCAARRASTPEWSRRDPQSPKSIWWHTEAITVGFRLVRPYREQDNLRGLRSKVTPQSP